MKDNQIIFRSPIDLAKFLYIIAERGATYRVYSERENDNHYWVVELTGGF